MDFQEIHTALHSPDEEVRRAILQELKKVPLPSAEEAYFAAMGDENWRVRKEAVDCYVARIPGSSDVKRLLPLIRSEGNAGLRNSAAEAVIRLGIVSVRPLIEMADDPDVDVRKIVVDAMGSIGDQLFIPVLLRLLRDPDINVAAAASEQLGNMGRDSFTNGPEMASRLIEVLLERDDVLFRFSVLRALKTLAQPSAVPEGVILLSEQDILKKEVYECLGAISDESSLGLLISGLCRSDRHCRGAALKALHNIYLRASQLSRASIESTLRESVGSYIITGVLPLHDIHDTELTTALLWITVISRDARCIPFLLEVYSDERFSDEAFVSLTCFGREAVQSLVARGSSDECSRAVLCKLIAECGFVDDISIIKTCLQDSSPEVRHAAVNAAGKLGAHSLIPQLISLIDDDDQRVYGAVVSTLQSFSQLSRSNIETHASQLCSSSLPNRRKAAAHLSASLNGREHLLLLLRDEDPQVRRAAVNAIGDIRVKDFESTLLKYISL